MVLFAVLVAGGMAIGGGYLAPITGTFTNGSTTVTYNGSTAVKIAAIDLITTSASATNLAINVSNIAAITNQLAAGTATSLSFTNAAACQRPVVKGGLIILTGGVAGATAMTNTYAIYLMQP
jgi:hypothetical protein